MRRFTATRAGSAPAEWLRRLNARHPWSHNDYFHSWVLAHLPPSRGTALDVGCGQGGLVNVLAPHFDQVVGTDTDHGMRESATRRVSGLDNVTISDRDWVSWPDESVDLVTMIAVLHHLDMTAALAEVHRVLAAGGRFLVVGLAVPRTASDHAWDIASMVSNPVIGFVHHPWPAVSHPQTPPFPMKDPTLSFGEVADRVQSIMPGAVMRRRLAFRHTIQWTKSV